MQYVLGIDIGTGSVKAVAINIAGQSVEVCQQHYSYSAPQPGYYEQDPEVIWNAFKTCTNEIIAKTGAQPLAIGLSSAMHSLIAVDEDCQALYPMITWADNRSAAIAKRLRTSAEGLDIYKATGTPLHAMSPLCKIIWMRENDAALFNKAHKFIAIKEYIWHKLFGQFIIDHSSASCTGLFDIEKLHWYPGALVIAGINEQMLSQPVPTSYTQNYQTIEGLENLNPGVPFVIGASDGCLANLGSMADRPGIAAMTIGTSGAVRVASNKPLPNTEAMTFSYILDEQTFICGGPINNGGVALQWWVKNNTDGEPTNANYDQLFAEAAKIPAGSNGLTFLPYLTGERAPIWDSESSGVFFGIKLQHTKAHFSRAVLEGICYALKDVLDAVQKNSEPITQINVSGGVTKSAIWVQMLADITGINMAVLQTGDASAVGAGLVALKSTGFINEYPTLEANLKLFRPDADNLALYRERFGVYKKLYVSLKDMMHGL